MEPTPQTTSARLALEGDGFLIPSEIEASTKRTYLLSLSQRRNFLQTIRRHSHRAGGVIVSVAPTTRGVARKRSGRGVSTRGDDAMWVDAPRASPWYPSVRLAYQPASGAAEPLCESCPAALSTGSAARHPGQRTLPSRPAQELGRTLLHC